MAYHLSPFRGENATREVMRFAIAHPEGGRWSTEREKAQPRAWRTMLWRCRVVLRHSRELAERVLDGSIALHEAFNEARPPQPRLRLDTVESRKSTPSLTQEAMAWAMACPKHTLHNEKATPGFRNAVHKCRVVLDHCPELAEKVLNGSYPLGKAFREIQPPRPKSTPSLPPAFKTMQSVTESPQSTPSLVPLKSIRSRADEISPADLREFLQVFAAPET